MHVYWLKKQFFKIYMFIKAILKKNYLVHVLLKCQLQITEYLVHSNDP